MLLVIVVLIFLRLDDPILIGAFGADQSIRLARFMQACNEGLCVDAGNVWMLINIPASRALTSPSAAHATRAQRVFVRQEGMDLDRIMHADVSNCG